MTERTHPVRKADLVYSVERLADLDRDTASRAVAAVFAVIESSLSRREPVAIKGFGNFEIRDRQARTGRNPQTGERIDIPSSVVVGFRPAPRLKGIVNGGAET